MVPETRKQIYDVAGNGIVVGATLQGFGLSNAGRFYTVQAIGGSGRVRLVEHLTGRDFWTFTRYYRVAEGGQS